MIADQAPVCNYPQGGVAITAGGDGIFLDSAGEPIKIWVDYMLKNGRTIIKTAQNEMAEAASFHDETETQLLILHPSSYRLFDSYCHPDWLSVKRRKRYDRYVQQHEEEEEDWTRKVLLKEGWVGRCVEAGRFLGENDDWAGCRVGGPPKARPVEIKLDLGTTALNTDVKRRLSVEDLVIDPPVLEDIVMEEPIIEDIKPEPVAPPTPVSVPAIIHVEPPTPLEPPIKDEGSTAESQPLAEYVDDLESLFGDRDRSPSPPAPIRRSRRSRSTTTKDREGPEHTSKPSLPMRSGSSSQARYASDELEDDHVPRASVASGSKRPFRAAARTSYEEWEFEVFEAEESRNIKPRSRRARYQAQAVSSDEEPLASRIPTRRTSEARSDSARISPVAKGKRKRKSAATSLAYGDDDDLDITMLDTGPSSQFQSPPPPIMQPMPVLNDGRLFSGLVFWVDLSMKNRGDLLKEIKTVGGKIVADYADATHVLIYKYAQQASQWKEPIATHARKGIWFLSPEWAKKSLAEKTRLSELDHCLPGSAIAATVSTKPAQPAPSIVHQSAGPAGNPTLPPGRLGEILRDEYRVMVKEGGLSPLEVATRLEAKYGLYSIPQWREQYKAWKNRTGQFDQLPPLLRSSAFAPLEESQLKVNSELPSLPPAQSRLDPAQHGSDTNVAISSKYTHLHGGPAYITTKTMASALSSYFADSGDNTVVSTAMADHMTATYPAYKGRTWRNFAYNWLHGTGRFSRHGPRWNGEVGPEDGQVIDDLLEEEAASETEMPAGGLLRYTDDEELAMGQFVSHQESNGEPITGGSWTTFAEVYPYRTKGAWAEHWRRFKDRIMKIVNDHQADEEVDELEEEPADSTYRDESPPIASGSKPKKQKSAVSKKDYEDLAHFIVDNIAEGDVPTSKDFDEFAEEHPHRNGAAWYTIWHRDRYRSTLLPLIEEYRRAAAPARSQSRTNSARPLPNAYTDEEEKAMAEFIVRHVPPDRLPKAADWAKFQKNHTRRSAPSWTEHYRVYKPRITALVEEIKESQPSIARRPAGTAQNAIELESEEEEEEEVEDIVPVRSARPPRNRDIIIIDED